MKKSYTIAGVGVCLGKRPGYEMLAQSAITGQPGCRRPELVQRRVCGVTAPTGQHDRRSNLLERFFKPTDNLPDQTALRF